MDHKLASKLKRWWIVGGMILGCLLSILWLAFQHIPGWYRPLELSLAQIDQVRIDTEQMFDLISQRLSRGESSTIQLTSEQINKMLAAQSELWPAATDWLGRSWSSPFMALEAEQIRLGVRYQADIVQSIISAQGNVLISDETIEVKINSIQAGSLPVALWMATPWLNQPQPQKIDAPMGQSNPTEAAHRPLNHWLELLQEEQTIRLDNQFQWPNGKIPFRLRTLDLGNNQLTLKIEPL